MLEVLRKHRLLTKTDIVKLTGLTYPTVSKSISSLHEAMLIQESGEGASRGGRPPLLYSFNPRAGVIVGVQIEKKRLSLGAFDLDLRLIDDLQFQVSSLKPADIIILIKKGVQEIARNQAEGVLYGVGIGSPGNIDPVDNTVVSPYQLRWRTPVDLIHPLEEELGVPVCLGNDINLAALGELVAFHPHNLTQPMVFVSVAQGVGAGLIINDTVYCGSKGGAGEIGHMSIDVNGKLCECGNRGCLEGSISSIVIGEQLRVDSSDAYIRLNKRIQDGCEEAHVIYDDLVKHLATALTNVINLFSPHSIVLGGEITELNGPFLDDLRKWLAKSCGNVPFNVENLQFSRLGSKASLYGAAALVEQQIFPKFRVPQEQVTLA